MSNSPKFPPRFVPTLTEVVDPASLGRLIVKTQADEIQPDDLQDVIDLVQRQIQPIFDRRLEEECDHLVRCMIASQWAELSARLQDEMDMFVRQVVADALRDRGQLKRSE